MISLNMAMLGQIPGVLMAQAATQEPQGLEAFLKGGFPMIIIMFVMFYFLIIRPQMKKQKEHQQMVNAIKTGDKVVAAGGIHGVVSNVKDNVVVLKIADSVKIEVEKTSVSTVNKPEGSDSKDK